MTAFMRKAMLPDGIVIGKWLVNPYLFQGLERDDNVFRASIRLGTADGATVEVDSRPSDALAVALRSGAEIRVAAAVLEAAKIQETKEDEAYRMILERLHADDLGAYEM